MSEAVHTLMVVTTTVASADDAQRLAAQAVQARLAACVQVEAITSHYVWQGQAHADSNSQFELKEERAQAVAPLSGPRS